MSQRPRRPRRASVHADNSARRGVVAVPAQPAGISNRKDAEPSPTAHCLAGRENLASAWSARTGGDTDGQVGRCTARSLAFMTGQADLSAAPGRARARRCAIRCAAEPCHGPRRARGVPAPVDPCVEMRRGHRAACAQRAGPAPGEGNESTGRKKHTHRSWARACGWVGIRGGCLPW